jgi:nucleotide-binding universal stress UspA family protein
MKTILVPTDFSKEAQAATRVAIAIAKKTDAEVILLHVLEDVEEGSFNVDGEATASRPADYNLFTMKLIEKVRRQLAKAVEQTADSGVAVTSRLRLGNAYHGIHTTITEQKVDLVVMGTTGSSGYEEVLVGSNTEKVVRRSKCPVLSVNKEPAAPDFKSIVYATSMRDDELNFARTVRKFQEIYDCPVHIVRINTPGMFINDRITKEKLNLLANQARFNNYTTNVYNDLTEEEGIIHFADSIDAGMIAMATHGRTGLAHLLNGSIAEGVVNHSARPVFTSVIDTRVKPVR